MSSRRLPPAHLGQVACIVLIAALLAGFESTPAAAQVVSVSGTHTGTTVNPGGDLRKVFQVQLSNGGLTTATLTSISFTNATTGPGSQAQKDLEWQTLELRDSRIQFEPDPVDPEANLLSAGPGGVGLISTATFINGVARFPCSVVIPGLQTVTLNVWSSASLTARDGDALDLYIPNAAALAVSGAIVTGTFPIHPSGTFPVDGMSAAQIAIDPVNTPTLGVGTTRNLAFAFRVPANGYQADVLQRIAVQNLGTARPGDEIVAMEAWLDDGNGKFEASNDSRLGPMVFTGDRWQISGLSVSVPLTGRVLFVTVDVAELSEPGRTIRVSLPTLPDVAVGMTSDNDGPVDRPASNPSAQTIAVVDRVVLAHQPVEPGTVAPGQAGVTLLTLVATNTYSVDKRITGLTVTNSGSGPGTQADRDGELQVLTLRDDQDGDGQLTASDPTLGTALFINGRASFGGFTWELKPEKTGRLFVTGDVALLGSSDNDVLSASLQSGADLVFTEPTALSAIFPLGPGASWRVNGMVAAQIDNRGAAPITLASGAGPVPALDVVVHRNGYQDDRLSSLAVINLGSATAADLADVRLYRDGGDGQFGGDDQDLGPLAPGAGTWDVDSLDAPLPAEGARLFVAVTASASPTDSATVRLAIPLLGLVVQSGNDGPINATVANPEPLLLSNRGLLASLSVQPAAVTTGQPVTVRMTVRNTGSEALVSVSPSSLTVSGTAGLAYASGPVPASASLGVGGEQIFTWTYTSTAVGQGRFSGSASGVGAGSGTPQQSIAVTSEIVQVFDPAAPLPWSASSAMPLSVNRGQTDVAPLFLTFGDGTSASDVRVIGLRLRVESSGGADIVPADLFSRMTVEVGAMTHVERTSLEASGSEIDLTLATPILVPPGGSVTAAITFDVAGTTVIPNFRLVIVDSTYLSGQDATTGAPVVLRLQGQPYPVRTGLARVVAEATEIDVAAVAGAPVEAARGQQNVPFATLRLTNPGITGVTSDVRVASFVVILRDSMGQAVSAPASVLQRVEVWSGPQLLADRPIQASEDSLIDLTLSPLLSVPVNAPLDVRILADLPANAALGAWRLSLGDSSSFDARDPNSGNPVAVVYGAALVQGDSVTVEIPADTVRVRGTPMMPPAVGVGASGVIALNAVLRHPGSSHTAAIRLDSLVVRSVDESRNPVPPGPTVERLHVRWNGADVASLADPPSSGNVMALGLPGLLTEPGESDTLTLVLDFEAAAPTGTFELILNASGLWVSDADTRLPLVVAAESGFEFPILSGLTRISAPSRTLVAGLVDHMPAALAADGNEVVAGEITLRNDATPGSGSIAVDHLILRAADGDRVAMPVGATATTVRLHRQGAPWGEAALLPGDTLATISGAPLQIAPQSPITLELRFVPRAGAANGLRLGFAAADVGVVQPSNPLLQIAVQPPPGQTFPLWTAYGSFTAASFEKSYANFPNPFAAGREPTHFAYYLPASGQVTLRIWTARGERVLTLLDGASRAQGLHQDDAWDGRNGHGDVVANGVYVAEIVVKLAGGESRRLLRKVAVVR